MYKNYTAFTCSTVPYTSLKFLLKMKIIVVFLILCFQLQVSANAQLVTLNLDNTSLKEVFKQLRKQTGYGFLYKEADLAGTSTVSLSFKNKELREVLDKCLSNQPLTYSIEKNFVVIKKKKTEAYTTVIRQAITITGKVTDENNEPLIGVSIRVKNTQAGSITDHNGNFKISVINQASVLVFRYLGFEEKEVPVGDNNVLEVTLKKELSKLNEIVVIGYGEVKRSDLTGAVSTVKVKDLENIPVTRVDQMLQGRIAGAEIVSTTGEPGASTSIRIRGTRSISATNEPLYVIDGVVDGIKDLNELNPSDVESIQVLKDASSTAIYGSRGSNGVILITTKTGNTGGKTNFNFRSDIGFSVLPRYLDLMNAQEFAEVENDRYYFENINNQIKPIEDYPYPNPYSLGDGTNWTKEILQTGGYQNHTFSASGGDKLTRYFFSANYHNTEGIIINSGLKRIQTRLNLDRTINKYVKAGLRFNYSNIDQAVNKADIGTSTLWYSSTIFLAPTMPAYKPDGSFNDWNTQWSGGTLFDSPLANASLRRRDELKKRMFSSFFVEIQPISSIKIKTSLSYNDYNRFDDTFLPSTLPTRANRNSGAYAHKRAYRDNNILNENTITYTKNWNNAHKLDAMYGFTYQRMTFADMFVKGDGYFIDEIETNDMEAIPSKENLGTTSSYEEQVRMSNLLRINYNYNGKYYLTVTGRADGASNFSKGHKWGYFPSAAVKWNMKKEDFLKDVRGISDMALRISGGISGNDAISRYRSLSQISSSSSGYIFDGAIPVSYYPSRISTDDLTWEKTMSYNVGLDMSFLRNKINVTVDAYKSKTTDLLLTVQLPRQTGYGSRIANIGKTENKGVELSVETRNITKRKFSWTSTLTFAHNKQKVLDIGGFDRISVYNNHWGAQYMMYGYVQGMPLNALWGMQYAGTWKSQTEIDQNLIDKNYVSASTSFYSPGRQRYIDQNNDGVLDNNDLVYLGNADPDLYGGIQNTFVINKFNIGVYFNYSLGGSIYNPTELFMGTGSSYHSNQYKYMVNRWHPVRNPDSDLPRANSKDDIPNDRFVHDASFLRLKNISLGYTFNMEKLTKNKINTLTFSANGNNVFLWKKYNGYDPEVSSESGSSTIRRMDNGAYPNSRTISFSVDLKF